MPQHDRQRSVTSSSLGPPPTFQVPAAASGDSIGMMTESLSANHSQEIQPEKPVQSNGFPHPEPSESESRDNLARPVPISKNQPSWDPFNATPIVEEGFQYDDRPKHPLHSNRVNEPGSLSIPADAASKSEQTNSGDTYFYDASEEPSDLKDDWVLVSPESEAKEIPVAAIESEIEAPPTLPAQSILDRPRGTIDIPPPSAFNRTRGSYEVSPPRSMQSKNATPVGPPAVPVSDVQPVPQQQISQQELPSQQTSQQDPEISSTPSFLPPIRRTSTFGFGFGPRQAKPRFPIDDEEPNVSTTQSPQTTESLVQPQVKEQQPSSNRPAADIGAVAETAVLAGVPIHESQRDTKQRIPATEPREDFYRQKQISPTVGHTSPNRPPIAEATSSDYNKHSQWTMIPQPQQLQPAFNSPLAADARPTPDSFRGPQQPTFNAPRAADIKSPPESFRKSQEAWRPNVVAPLKTSPNKWEDETISPQRYSFEPTRPSLEHSRPRGHSGSGSFTQRPDSSFNERLPQPGSFQQPKLFEQPPSSAQRYPELFQSPQQPGSEIPRDSGDLPAHYYQAPLAREEVFLPRQQTNEYQLPGVGPPADEPRSAGSRRNSGFFRELGERISRGASRERGASISRDGGMPSPGRPLDSRGGYEYAESSVTSEEMQEHKKRRSSFFGNLNHASTGGLGPPQSRESMVAHHAGSRTDLLATPQPSPVGHDRKRSFFGSHSAEPKSKPNKLSRASTSNLDDSAKKRRFSGLGGFFGKAGQRESRESTPEQRPQATRALSHHERQPLESPQFDQQLPVRPPPQQAPTQNAKAPSQRQLLSKLSTNASSFGSPRQENKSRRPSASGLLSGIMGRRSQQQERDQDSRSSGSQPAIQQVPPAQTYTDLQEQQPQNVNIQQPPPMIPWQDSSNQPPERGRRTSREPPIEPEYDSVPIPGGYSLVRGQGAMIAPTTYDPRGLIRLQQVDPRSPYAQQQMQSPYEQQQTPLQSTSQQHNNEQQYQTHRTRQPDPTRASRQPSQTKQPNLGAVETYQNYQSGSTPRRLSRENLLARSPARSPEGQQRPYQLSLPEDDSDCDEHLLSEKDIELSPPTVPSPVTQPQHDTIQRLQNPILRHPQSPAGYPLPVDIVFSPINPRADDLPPPPPPKSPRHSHADVTPHNARLNAERELDRSNTHRTAVSGISQISGLSGERGQGVSLSVPNKEIGPYPSEGGAISSPSPTPPSVNITPERRESPSPQPQAPSQSYNQYGQGQTQRGQRIKTTILNRGPSPDLYDASPRLPKSNGNSNSERSRSQLGVGDGSIGKKNERELEKQRVLNKAQEEKIFYGDPLHPDTEEDIEPSMSATSYPGQEWNPYMGVYDEGYD